MMMMMINRAVRVFAVLSLCALLIPVSGCSGVQFHTIDASFEHQTPPQQDYTIGTIEDLWAIVEVTINGQGPFRMLLDTGADSSLLSTKVAAQLDLNEVGTARLRDIHGKTEPHVVYWADEIRLGPVHLYGAPLITTDSLDWFFERYQLDGLLGYYGINLYTLDLDYPNGVVRISDQPLRPDDPNVVEIVGMRGATVMIRLEHTPASGGASLSGVYGVDSGGKFVLSVPEKHAKHLAQRATLRNTGKSSGLNGTSKDNRVVPLHGEIQLGPHRVTHAQVELDNAHRLIGHEFLQCFRVQIDPLFKHMRFSLPEPVDGPVRIPVMYGIGVMDVLRIENELIVTRIADQSPAMLAGLRPNDRVVEVNGESAVSPSGYRWLTWEWPSNEPVRMIIERRGERLEMQMGMEPLFPDDPEVLLERSPDLELPGVHIRKLPDGTYEMYQ
ncbi:MAG: aspartyl protease family protein [Phycisphaerales bacterium JB047]